MTFRSLDDLPNPSTEATAGALSPVLPARVGTPARARSAGHGAWRRRARRTTTPLVLLGLWQLGASTGEFSTKLFASPWLILKAFATLLGNGQLESALWISLIRVAGGLGIGVPIGLVLAVIAGLSRRGEDYVDPSVQMVRTIPVIALSGLFIVWFGIGEEAKMVIIASGCFFPVYINTFAGIRGVDTKLFEAAKVLGVSRWGLIRDVIVPGALPNFLVGLRYALGVSWLVLFFAEQDNAQSGIGFLMTQAQQDFQIPVVFVGMIVYALLGLGADLIVRFIEKKALTWRTSFSGT
jgi:sulfonate transport system permease protein